MTARLEEALDPAVEERCRPEVASKEMLPRGFPFVGLLRHAPSLPPQKAAPGPAAEAAPGTDRGRRSYEEPLLRLLHKSPYIGFCRHAPPSPTLNFSRPAVSLDDQLDFSLLPGGSDEALREPLAGSTLPAEVWAAVFSFIAEPGTILPISLLAKGFREVVLHPGAWQGTVVRLQPAALPRLAPRLDLWAEAWAGASRLVVPQSKQLLGELAQLLPCMPLEVAWRFDRCAAGEGLEVIRSGASVRRVAEDDVVVLGDAPVVVLPGRPPYIEVRLEEFEEGPGGDGVNEFGIGFTACNPEELEELGAVAAEVPNSWVVDFTRTMVCLSVDNCEEARGYRACSTSLARGDRVGLRVSPEDDAIEVFVNGHLRDRLRPSDGRRVPPSARLFPVLDLFGRATRVMRTGAEKPER